MPEVSGAAAGSLDEESPPGDEEEDHGEEEGEDEWGEVEEVAEVLVLPAPVHADHRPLRPSRDHVPANIVTLFLNIFIMTVIIISVELYNWQ